MDTKMDRLTDRRSQLQLDSWHIIVESCDSLK
jgi:hypothetical protein